MDTLDAKGKIKKTYPHDQIMTPWERLKSIAHYETYLKPGVTAPSLDHEALSMSDNEAAKKVQHAPKQLFQSINRRSKSVT